MPKQETQAEHRNTQLTTLATQLKTEQAEFQLRLANYFTAYGFDPEQVDFARAGKLIEDYGDKVATVVFSNSSANLQERVSYVVKEWQDRQSGLDALTAAGAEISKTEEERYVAALNRVFRQTRVGQQAASAGVA